VNLPAPAKAALDSALLVIRNEARLREAEVTRAFAEFVSSVTSVGEQNGGCWHARCVCLPLFFPQPYFASSVYLALETATRLRGTELMRAPAEFGGLNNDA
jgi:hypothetical protein